jgi:hypothetical protein
LDLYAGVIDDKPDLKTVDLNGNEYSKNYTFPDWGSIKIGGLVKTELNPHGIWYDSKMRQII